MLRWAADVLIAECVMHDSKNRSDAIKTLMENPNSKSNLKHSYNVLLKDNGNAMATDE